MLVSAGPARTLREEVVQQVRSEIVSGRASPGTLYTVPGLAAQMGVSTTPVREALLELSRSGLVSALRNRGFLVEGATLQDLEDLFNVRVMLERFALETVARRRLTDPDSLTVLADEVASAVERDDVNTYIETDRRFHETLVSRAGNPRLTRLVMAQRDDMRLYGIDSKEGRQRQIESVDEHYQMIKYALEGEVEQIGKLITRHIMEWKPLFAAAVAAHGSPQPAGSGETRS
jgi:DNA-binding GntR family transcriptional regulator